MREVICICLAEGEGHERYQKLIHCLKKEEVRLLQGAAGAKELFSWQEKERKAVIFLISMDDTGINLELDAVLKNIASIPGCLEGLSAGIITVGDGELYIKEAARKTAFVLNRAGCHLHGKAFTEVTGSMRNMKNQAAYRKVSLEEAFLECAKETIAKAAGVPERTRGGKVRRLTCIHSSREDTSNSYAYWKLVREQIAKQRSDIEISEINLYGEQIQECRGCSFQVCQSLGEQRRCIFGGIMTEKVYPAIEHSDAVILLCPNYNDAIGANLCACINRLTALYRSMDFSGKYLYVIVVSGYSGGELVAEQVIDAMALNKGFTLPKYAVDIQMANLPGEILEEEGIHDCALSLAKRILS